MFKKKAWALLAVFAAFVCLTACGDGLGKASKNLTTYTIAAEFNAETKTLQASQKVVYVNNYDVPLSNIKFHLYPNAYREGAVFNPTVAGDYPNGRSYGGISVSGVKINGSDAIVDVEGADENMISVVLLQELYPTEKATIEMNFELKIPNVHHRFGYGEYAVNLGNWYPVAAEYKNGAFLNDPYYSNGDPFCSAVANYDVTLTMPQGYIAAASGKQNSISADGGKTTVNFSASVMRDFALVLSDSFGEKTATVDGINVHYYYFADTDPDLSLKAATDSIKTFNKMFGDYPYPDYSVVQTHFATGGMEYPGLVYINDALDRKDAEMVIIHETAHQWWYGLVGNDQVREAWLDEALAEYSTTLFFETNPGYSVTKSERIMQSFRDYLAVAQIFEIINGKIDTSMTRAVNEFNTSTEYTCMVYVKGQLMYDSIRGLIGDTAFMNGLKLYCTNNKYKIATKAELIGAFESASGKDIEGIFNSWLDGKIVISDLYSNK